MRRIASSYVGSCCSSVSAQSAARGSPPRAPALGASGLRARHRHRQLPPQTMFHRYILWNVAMSSDELSLFSYEILGLVGRDGAGAHDLLRMARRGRILDWAGESQYYTEPKRLAGLGYLEAHSEPGRTRARTVYTLTERVSRRSARTPRPGGASPRSRASRSFACCRRPRRRADDAREPADAPRGHRRRPRAARGGRGERRAAAPPEQVPADRDDFLRRYVDLHRELVDEVERELSAEEPPRRQRPGVSRPADRPGR